MRTIIIYLSLLLSASCSRRSLVDEVCLGQSSSSSSVTIPVKVDWSESGITPSSNSYDEEYVHRLTLRFFPEEGGEAFDRYLEGDVSDGYVELPVGVYSVVAFNESIYDPYWEGVFEFENIDDYDNFMAVLAAEDEDYSSEAYKLASWSLGEFEVTEAMNSTRSLSTYEEGMLSALEDIKLLPLTCYLNITATITNLVSAQNVYCDVDGFSSRVYMASGESHTTQTKHSMELVSREYSDDEMTHGSISHTRLILTKSTHEEAYFRLSFEVMLSDGTLHSPDEPLEFDVEHQITRYATDDFDLSAEFELPEISTGIDVEGWIEEEVVTIY